MATKTKLRQAIERQAGQLEDAQREMVLAEFNILEQNINRNDEIWDTLKLDSKAQVKMDKSERKQLMTERHQLITEITSMSSHISRHLRDTGTEDTDEFDEFIRGGK